MWGRLKPHHKIGGSVAASVVANKALDHAGEHIFLAVHDWISHAGYLWVTVACCGAALVPVAWLKWRNKKES